MFGFGGSCFSCGDNPNDGIRFTVAVADDEELSGAAVSENNETIFLNRMIRVIYDKSIVIIEHGRSFFEGNSVFLFVYGVFVFIPLKTKHIHNYIVIINAIQSSEWPRKDNQKNEHSDNSSTGHLRVRNLL